MLFCTCRCVHKGYASLSVSGFNCWQTETDYKYIIFGDDYSTLFSHIIFHIPYFTVPYRVKYAAWHFIDGLLKIYILKCLDNIKQQIFVHSHALIVTLRQGLKGICQSV